MVPAEKNGEKMTDRLGKLAGVVVGAKSMLIIMQNNPDPDAIAAAAALRALAHEIAGVTCSLAHSGAIGRAENAALLRYLGLNTRELADIDLGRFDRLAMVDAQPGAGNVAFPSEVRLDIVIDHHPVRRETRSARYTDIRRRYGATSSMMFEYLKAAELPVDARLATALVYGIRSDTQDLGRESTKADVSAFLALYPSANPRALARIVSAPLPRSYFAKLRVALDNATMYGNRVVSNLGTLDSQEMIAESADLFLRVEGCAWSLCMGTVEGTLHLSLRTTDREGSAGRVARQLAGSRGHGGGHQALAAAQIPLRSTDQSQAGRRRLIDPLVRRFLRATGSETEPGTPLTDPNVESQR
jgi:nanoRNase/pAp phosphatase (c-di-AMP/oligoRNAs hydrolase)